MTRDELLAEYMASKAELQKKYEEELNNLELGFKESLIQIDTKKDFDDTSDMSIAPLRATLKIKGLTMKYLSDITGINYVSLYKASCGKSFLKTDKVALIASKLQVPVSSVITFNNYECKPEYIKRYGIFEEFVVPDNYEGIVTYKPLRDLIVSFYEDKDEKKTLSDLFDKLPKMDLGDNDKRKENVKKALAAQGIDINHHSESYWVRPGLSPTIRAKINKDKPVNMRVIYEICKLLQCNVDFVMGWK